MSNQSSGSPQNFAFNFVPAPIITPAVTGGVLQLSWPANYTGLTLQSQTDAPGGGLGSNWGIVCGSTASNQLSTTMDQTNGSVFFRLIDQ